MTAVINDDLIPYFGFVMKTYLMFEFVWFSILNVYGFAEIEQAGVGGSLNLKLKGTTNEPHNKRGHWMFNPFQTDGFSLSCSHRLQFEGASDSETGMGYFYTYLCIRLEWAWKTCYCIRNFKLVRNMT